MRKGIVAAAPVVLWALSIGGVAHSSEVYQGNDVSYGYDANHRVVVCDRESDDHGVHSDFYAFTGSGPWRVDDLDGFGGNCYEGTYLGSGVAKHRTVEELPFPQPDAKSGWSYH